MTRPRLLVPWLLAALLVTACTSDDGTATSGGSPDAQAPRTSTPSPTPTSRTGGTLRFGLGGDPSSLDPRFIADADGALVVDALFDSLVALDDDLEAIPAAAESWEVSGGGTVYTFTLRAEATFHDGSPVDAESFVRTFHRIADGTASPPSPVAYQLEPVVGYAEAQADGAPLSGVTAVDERTLRIELSEPFPEFLEVLSRPSLAPVPASADEDVAAFSDLPVGNGPFQMAGEPWRPGEFIRVTRYDDHRQPPLLDEVLFQIYAEDDSAAAQYGALEDGRLHVAEVPATQRIEAIERYGISDDGYAGPGLLDGATTTLYYYGFNVEQPPFDDPAVRAAVSLLIDRRAIVDDITHGSRLVAQSVVPPSLADAQEDACPYCGHDPELAAQLLTDRGEDAPPIEGPITILHNDGETHGAIAEVVAESLRTGLGVEVATEALPLREYVGRLRAGEMGLFRLGWQGEYPSAEAFLRPLFHSSSPDNLTRYASEDVDRLLDEARATADESERVERLREAERLVLQDAAVAPIFVYRHGKVVAPVVRDLRLNALGRTDLSRVWLDTDG